MDPWVEVFAHSPGSLTLILRSHKVVENDGFLRELSPGLHMHATVTTVNLFFPLFLFLPLSPPITTNKLIKNTVNM